MISPFTSAKSSPSRMIDKDIELAKAVQLSWDDGKSAIEFQFPPEITSDNKQGNWKDFDVMTAEPMSIYMGGQAREVGMKWIYIVGASTNWDADRIAKNVKTARGYFYDAAKGTCQGLTVKFQAYKIVGKPGETKTFRLMSVNVSHSGPMIDGYPLKTEISASLKYWLTIDEVGDREGEDSPDSGEVEKIPSLDKLSSIGVDWQ